MTRTCTDCKETHPLTTEYFPWNNRARSVYRTNCRRCHALKRKRYRQATHEERNGRADNPRLPLGPLADWLTSQSGYTPTWVSMVTGIDEATIRRMTDGKAQFVNLDTVDRILVAFHCSPQVLPELYPELYVFDG